MNEGSQKERTRLPGRASESCAEPRASLHESLAILRGNVRHDLPASLVVFLVALPLSLGIAIASGAPLMAGLIAAVVGGIVAGAIGGSPLQVSGPAAGLTVVVAEIVNKFGWEMTCLITLGAGALQGDTNRFSNLIAASQFRRRCPRTWREWVANRIHLGFVLIF